MEYPSQWQELFNFHQKQIASGNLTILDPDPDPPQAFGLTFKVSGVDAKRIEDVLERCVPVGIRRKLFFQPASGFHFTIQWSPDQYLEKIDLDNLSIETKKLFDQLSPMAGDLYLPFVGAAGLYGLLKTNPDSQMQAVRRQVAVLWERFDLPFGLKPQDLSLAYISLIRYRENLSSEEIRQLENIPTTTLAKVNLSQVWLAKNDKFMTPEKTTVFDKINLFTR